MIPVLVVPVLAGPALLYRMIHTIDVPVGRLIVIDNGDVVNRVTLEQYAQSFTRHVTLIASPTNLGVATSWNLGIKLTPFEPWWMVASFDVTFPAGSLARMAEAARRDALVLSGGSPPWCAFTIGDQVVETVGLFDERFHPAYFEDTDYQSRCGREGVPVIGSGAHVEHENSSTLKFGYQGKNVRTYGSNAALFDRKRLEADTMGGQWDLTIRREQSWD